MDERSNRRSEDDGSDPDASAEQPADCEHADLDAGADHPDRVAPSCDPRHQTIARTRTETGADVHTRRDSVQDNGCEERHPSPERGIHTSENGIHDGGRCFEHSTDQHSVENRAQSGALPKRHPQHQHSQARDHYDGSEPHVERARQPLMKNIPRIKPEIGGDEQRQTHSEQHQPSEQLDDTSQLRRGQQQIDPGC